MMSPNPQRVEIDHHVIKLIIGVIALSLAPLTCILSKDSLKSISASYHAGGSSRDIFVGFLFAISAFLLAYNGKSRGEMILSKFAAIAALGVALFPCKCEGNSEIIPYIHGASAAAMFLSLAVFCFIFFQRANEKENAQAKLRAIIYAICGIIIVASILTLAIDGVSDVISSALSTKYLIFYGEAAGLTAFGIAWLTASCILPVITNETDRFHLSPFQKNG